MAYYVDTIVRNTSGQEKHFSYLGSHGVTLADDEEFTVPGDIIARLSPPALKKKLDALRHDLDEENLEILQMAGTLID